VSSEPGYGGGTFCAALLNGQPVNPAGFSVDTQRNPKQQLRVNYGGRLFGITQDQIWNEWANYAWLANDGADLASGPAATPVYGGLPVFNPPYTPSPENTSISGGTGSLQTADGIWTFGAVSGSGYDLVLNGLTVWEPGFYPTNLMTVYGHGQLFFRTTNGAWHLWAGNQPNPSTGPTARPVPVNATFSPSPNPSIPAGSPIGTLVVGVSVTMSDGSPFVGTIALPDGTHMSVSGSSIVTASSPLIRDGYVDVTVSQNGSSFATPINVYPS